MALMGYQTTPFSSKPPMDSNNNLAMHTSKQTKAFLCGPIKSVKSMNFAITTILAAAAALVFSATAQTPKPASKTKEETTTKVKPEPLSGAQLWAINCSRCHTTRTPGEFTASQWQAIIRHMRIRANLPAAQAKEIQKYFEASAGK